jgi:thioredoxin-like negative regulator of GroEL
LKRVALLVVAVALAAPQAFAGGPWLTSLAAAQKQAKEKKQFIFVDMFADWCGWCHQLEQQVFPSQVFQDATKNYVLLRLNTEDGGDGTRLAQQFGVSSLPTSVVMTHDSVVVGLVRGFLPADTMAKAIGEVEKNYGEFRKRVSAESSIATEYQKRLDLAREFRAHQAHPDAITRFRKLTAESAVPVAIRDQAYFDLALTQFMTRKGDEALKTIQKFATLQSKGDPFEKSRFLAVEVYMQRNDFASAVDELRSFKEKFPNSPLIATADQILPQLEKRVPSKVQ